MRGKIFLAALLSVLIFAATASAEDEEWVCDYAFPATPVVKCVDQNGEFDHNIYYFSAGDNKCLVVVCHGSGNSSENYGTHMYGRYRHDYPNAVAESIAYWTQQGMMRNVGRFNYVFMSTCHSGYAQQSVTLPIYNVSLVRAIDYKGITGFSEEPYGNGQVLIKLYRVIPRNGIASRSSGALSTFLQNNNVRGFRSIGTRSSTKPKGVQILAGEL